MTTKKQPIDQTLIRQLANLLNETDLSEIEVERDDMRIRVARQVTMNAVAPAVQAAQSLPATSPDAPSVKLEAQPAAKTEKGQPIPSPMVGTAYLSPKPGDPPFISVGDKVREGQTLMIIEAMKHMNQIPSPQSGTVLEILVEDGRPVEFGETLIVLDRG